MSKKQLSFVSFSCDDNQFLAALSMDDFVESSSNVEVLLHKASKRYGDSIGAMRAVLSEIQSLRDNRIAIPARKVWKLGDLIFKLTRKMENLSLQIDGLYAHLRRDLNVNHKWLEKVVTLRRYLPRQTLIPKPLNWGKCDKGTRRVAEELLRTGKKG